MIRMKTLIFLTIFSTAILTASPFTFKTRLETAKAGDYVVTEANKMITLLAVRSKTPDTLILEEISVPRSNLKKLPSSWASWIKKRAPGHTSWTMVEIDLQTGKLLESYSFSKSAWINLSQQESLLATLLELPMEPVKKEDQKKIGPPPMGSEPDFRKTWAPPLVVDGKKIENALFDVYKTVWPKDESEISNQEVSLYFDQKKSCPFPFWIQVQTSHASAAIRTIDSGKHLPTVHRTIPRRVPEFIGLPIQTEQSLKLNLKSPHYYKTFELFAIDITNQEKQIFPVDHELIQGEDEWKTVEIDLETLKNILQPNHRYTWLLVPVGHTESYTEMQRPFLWSLNPSQ